MRLAQRQIGNFHEKHSQKNIVSAILRRVQSAINQCRNSTSCLRLLRENNVNLLDLDVASEFLEIPFDLPDVSLLMSDIQVLVQKGLSYCCYTFLAAASHAMSVKLKSNT